jgi:serine/threonine-protein kinase
MQQIGQYTIVGVLGEGGMATVYEAHEQLSGRPVALKVLQDGIVASARARELFIGEMSILGRIDHPNVVRLLGSMELDGRLVMVLELIRGETLRATLSRSGRLPWPRAVEILQQILSGLAAAHAQQPPIAHRDLKPENVMIALDGSVKVTDFGIAKVIREGTMATTDVGTLQYMCPEQIEGLAIDHRADLYNAGLVLYEMLAGTAPFRSKSTRELLNAQCTLPPPPLPQDLAGLVPADLVHLMLQLLAKAPEERPRDAHEVLHRLATIRAAPPPTGNVTGYPMATPGVAPAPGAFATTHGPPIMMSTARPGNPRVGSGSRPVVMILAVVALLVVMGLIGATSWLVSHWSAAAKKPSQSAENASVAPAGRSEEDEDEGVDLIVVACAIDGRAPDVEDLVAFADAATPTLVWLDGATGTTYRTLEVDMEVLYCVSPRVLGLPRDRDRRLELLDAPTGNVLGNVETEFGIEFMTRVEDLLVIRQADESDTKAKIPGCRETSCQGGGAVRRGEVTRVEDAPVRPIGASALCSFQSELEREGITYSTTEKLGFAVVTAARGDDKQWSTRVDVGEGGYLLNCSLAANDDFVGVLISDTPTGDAVIRLLDATTGKLRGSVGIGPVGTTPMAVSMFFANSKFFFLQSRLTDRLVAADPAAETIAWRR